MAVEIGERDCKIFQFTYKYRAVTYRQIHQMFFTKNHEVTSRNRIRQLCNDNFLKSMPVCSDRDYSRCVSPTKKCLPFIENSFGFKVDHALFKSDSIDHDIRLADIGKRLERLKTCESFFTENLLQSASYLTNDSHYRDAVNLQSDGILTLNGPESSRFFYAVELEINKKTPERYKSKLESYYQTLGLDGVIYVCADAQIKRAIERSDQEVSTNRKSFVYLAKEEDVLKSTEEMIFLTRDTDGIRLY